MVVLRHRLSVAARWTLFVLLVVALAVAFGGAAFAQSASEEPYTENLPHPRGTWTSEHPDPPAAIDPRLMEQLPAEQGQHMAVIPNHLSLVAEAHYSYGVAAGPDGSIYYTEYNRRNIVRLFPNGKQSLLPVKTELFGKGGFYGIAVDRENNIYVALDSDIGNGGILRIAPDGRERFVVTGINRPRQVSLDSQGNLYVVLESENRILRWDRLSGATETVVSSQETSMPEGVAVDAEGNIYFSEYGGVGRDGVMVSAGKVRVKQPDGTIRLIADGFWRARGLALDANGVLYLTTEANAWDHSDSGLIVRIQTDGTVERIVQGINYPQFPALHPNGKLYVTMAMDDLLVSGDPNQEYARMDWDAVGDVEVYTSNGQWLPDDGGANVALDVRIETLLLKGRLTVQDETQPVSVWIRIPAEQLDLYRGELPYTLPEYPTPGRYQLPEVAASSESGTVRSLGLPARAHAGPRWPMIIGYSGPEPQFKGREWPAEGFDDTPEAYLVHLEWQARSPQLDFAAMAYSSSTVTLNWTQAADATAIAIEQSPLAEEAWTAANTGTLAADATSAVATGLAPSTAYKFRLAVTGGPKAGNVNIVSLKTMPAYALTYSAGPGGSLAGDAAQTVDYRGSGTAVTAVPDAGFRFVRWSDGKTEATRTDADVTTALSVSAEFANEEAGASLIADFADVQYLSYQATFHWTAAVDAIGLRIEQSPLAEESWTTSDAGTIAVDATGATVTGLTPKTDYKFRLVVLGGENAGESNIVSFTTLTPTFALTYAAGSGGSLTGNMEQQVDYLASGMPVSAVPDAGYRFVRWSDGKTEATRTDADVTADLNVTAEFAGVPVADFSDVVYLSRQATFRWTKAIDATAIRIEQSPLAENTWTAADTGTIAVDATSATVTGLTPNTAYKFRLVVTGGPNAGESNIKSFTMMPTYTLTYSAGSGGSLTGDAAQTVDYRGSGTAVTAVADAGYRFVRWSDGKTEATRTDADVTAALSVSAEFASEAYEGPVTDFADTQYLSRQASFSWTAAVDATAIRIEQSPLAEDTWTAADTGTIAVDAASATVTGLTPNTAYKFRLVVTGGPNAGESNIKSFTMMPTYTLTYSAGVGGSLTGDAAQTVDYRGSGTAVTAVEDAGYRFVRWSDGKTEATRTDADVTATLSVSAEFASEAYEGPVTDFADTQYLSRQASFSWTAAVDATAIRIEQSPLEEDTWTVADTGTIAVEAASATVTGLTPNTAYKFRLVVTGGPNAGESNIKSFTMMPTYTLTYSAGSGGSLTGDAAQTVDYRGSGTAVTAVADAGYRFVRWSDGKTEATRTDADVTAALIVSAEFASEAYEGPVTDFADTQYLSRQASFSWTAAVDATAIAIEQSPLAEDTWTVADTGTIAVDAASATVTGLTPSTAYKFRLVVTGGPNAGESNIKSFTMMPTYTLTYSAGSGGSLTGDAAQTVDYRGSGTAVTAVADAGYRFVRWSDGKTEATRTDADVTAALSVSAEFASTGQGASFDSNISAVTNGDGASRKDTEDSGVLVNGTGGTDGVTVARDEQTGRSVTLIEIEEEAVMQRLQGEDSAKLEITVTRDSDIVLTVFHGQFVKHLEDGQVVIEIRTPKAIYRMPAQQLDISGLAERLGHAAALQDFTVEFEIAEASVDMSDVLNQASVNGGFAVIAPPLNFTVRVKHADAALEVTTFQTFVERFVAIPDDVDAGSVTTAIVIDPDGTVRHVPTKIVFHEGKYYAKVSSMSNSVYALIRNKIAFTDVANHWAKNVTNDLGSRMIVHGEGGGLYRPEAAVTRSEFAAVVVNALGLTGKGETTAFTDVDLSHWYYKAVKVAHAYGLIAGYDDLRFRPMDTLTREQAMVIAAKAMQLTGLIDKHSDPQTASELLNAFADAKDVSGWALDSVAHCLQIGIITGESAMKLAPAAEITRAQMAVIVHALLQKSELV